MTAQLSTPQLRLSGARGGMNRSLPLQSEIVIPVDSRMLSRRYLPPSPYTVRFAFQLTSARFTLGAEVHPAILGNH
jgi:hypothetical protein